MTAVGKVLVAVFAAACVQGAAAMSAGTGEGCRLAPLAPHPRLFADAEGFKTAQSRLEALFPEGQERKAFAALAAKGDSFISEPTLERTLTGHRLLRVSRSALERIGTLAFLWQTTGERRYADRAIAEARAVSAFEDWNPRHFLDVAEMTLAVALARDWLDDVLSPEDKRLFSEAILLKGLTKGDGRTLADGWWSRCDNNWNAVCHGGLSAGAAAVREDFPEVAEKILRRARERLPLGIAAFDGGSCPEGPMYWAYAANFTAIALDVLESQFADGVPELFAAEGLAALAGYMDAATGPTGLLFNYSDCNGGAARKREAAAASWYLASRFGRAESLARFERPLFVGGGYLKMGRMLPFALLWNRPGKMSETRTSEELCRSFGGRNPFAVLRTGWKTRDWYVGVKAGTPSANHGHMDGGSFVLDAGGIRWACDLGAEDYGRVEQTGAVNLWSMKQGSSRWSLFRLGVEGHGTLVIDGARQNVAGCATVAVSSNAVPSCATVDLTPLYPNTENVTRTFTLSEDELVVRDALSGLRPGAGVTWNMNTGAKATAKGNRLELSAAAPDGTLRRMALVATPGDVSWGIEPLDNPRTPADSPNSGLTRVRFRRTAGEDGKLDFSVSFRLLPDASDFCHLVNPFWGSGAVENPKSRGMALGWNWLKAQTGNTHPGAVMPFGWVSACAYSGNYSSGYGQWGASSQDAPRRIDESPRAWGFTHFHNSGVGAIGSYYNYFLFTPSAEGVDTAESSRLDGERASPGYYAAELTDYGAQFELAARPFATCHRYAFKSERGRIRVDLVHAGLKSRAMKNKDYRESAELLEVERVGGCSWVGTVRSRGMDFHFAVVAKGPLGEGSTRDGAIEIPVEGRKAETFIGFSFKDVAEARARADEAAEAGFDESRRQAESAWENALSGVKAEFADEAEKRRFYSALYHSLVKPVDCGTGFRDYATLWDIYKTQLPLVLSTQPQVARRMMEDMMAVAERHGYFPIAWMMTDGAERDFGQAVALAVYTLSDAFFRGVLDERDYPRLKRVFEREIDGADTDGKSPTYVLDLAGAARAAAFVAEACGDAAFADAMKRKSEIWRTAYDPATGLLVENAKYYEGNFMNYSFRPLPDMDARVRLAGGKERFCSLLDDFFRIGYQSDAPETREPRIGYFEGLNNESDMESPYAYYWCGRYDRTAEVVDAVRRCRFGDGAGGCPGNNDSGGTSSWYVWSCLGLYPLTGTPDYLIASPSVASAELRMTKGILKIKVERESEKSIYPVAWELNGKPLDVPIVSVQELEKGGELKIRLVDRPIPDVGRILGIPPEISVRSVVTNGVEVRWFEEMVPMKDGARLYTYGALPAEGETCGIVFRRDPYVPEKPVDMVAYAHGQRGALARGYAYVNQHVRGAGMSEGEMVPYENERMDGLASLEWIRRLPHYGGEVFLSGNSYLASVHWSYLSSNPPDVKGAALSVQDVNRYNIAYRNGFFKIGLHGDWFKKRYKRKDKELRRDEAASFSDFPLAGFSSRYWGEAVPSLDNVLRHPHPDDPYWRSHEPGSGSDYLEAFNCSTMPVLLQTGFYDIYTDGICAMWRGATPARRANCALVIDAYGHGGGMGEWAKGTRGEFAGGSRKDSGIKELDWFDYCRTGRQCEAAKPGLTRYYALWENAWKETPELTDGLRKVCFALGETPRTWTYDPQRPLPEFPGSGGICFGGMGLQPEPDFRDDVVSFILPPQTERLDVRGRMTLELAVSSDCADTCFYARVSVRKDDGKWYLLRDDITSLSFADGPYAPGTERKLSFRFADHAFMLEKGDVLRVDVSSANSQFAPHPNVAGDAFSCAEPRIARNAVFPSRSVLILPVSGTGAGGYGVRRGGTGSDGVTGSDGGVRGQTGLRGQT